VAAGAAVMAAAVRITKFQAGPVRRRAGFPPFPIFFANFVSVRIVWG
jgi:hypothetical protein